MIVMIPFQADSDLFQIVEMFRPAWPEIYTEELVVLKCCAPPEGNPQDTKYTNQSSSMFSAIYLSPPININWTDATGEFSICLLPSFQPELEIHILMFRQNLDKQWMSMRFPLNYT